MSNKDLADVFLSFSVQKTLLVWGCVSFKPIGEKGRQTYPNIPETPSHMTNLVVHRKCFKQI